MWLRHFLSVTAGRRINFIFKLLCIWIALVIFNVQVIFDTFQDTFLQRNHNFIAFSYSYRIDSTHTQYFCGPEFDRVTSSHSKSSSMEVLRHAGNGGPSELTLVLNCGTWLPPWCKDLAIIVMCSACARRAEVHE